MSGNKGHEAGADRLHPHEDGADKGACAPDHPSVISGPDQAAPTTETAIFPIQGEKGRPLAPIPWSVIAPHEAQARYNHDQTLKRLAERGGLSPCEAVAVLEDRNWHEMPYPYAEQRLRTIVAERQVGYRGNPPVSEASGSAQSASAIQHPQIAPPEDEQTDQARSAPPERVVTKTLGPGTATVGSRRAQLWDAILDFANVDFASARHRAAINDAIDALIQQVVVPRSDASEASASTVTSAALNSSSHSDPLSPPEDP